MQNHECHNSFHLILSALLFIIMLNLTLRAEGNSVSRVSLNVTREPLASVLKTLSRQARVNMVFSDELVDSIFVSCHFSNLTLDEALRQVLKNTAISFKWVNENRVVLIPPANYRFTLTGYIMDAESNEALPFANISVVGTSRGTSSNREGRFTLLDLPNRPCSLRVDYIGYSSKTIVITPGMFRSPIRILLHKTAYSSQEINVYASKNEIIRVSKTPSKLSISPGNFSNLPIIGDKDIFRSLQLMPGILSNSNGSATISIRGGLPSENLVRLDGMTLYHLDHSFGFFSAFNIDAVKDVQVYKGGYPAKYGGRVAGMVDMTVKNGDMNKPGLTLGLNRLSANVLAELPLFGKGALLVSGRRSYSNYLLESLYKQSLNIIYPEIDNNGSSQNYTRNDTSLHIFFYDFNSKLSILPSSRDVVTFSFYLGKDDTYLYNERIEPSYIYGSSKKDNILISQFTNKNEWGNRGYSSKWFRQWNPEFYTTTLIASSEYSINNKLSDKFKNIIRTASGDTIYTLYSQDVLIKDRLEDISFRWENVWQVNPVHLLEFGADISQIRIKYRLESDLFTESFSQEENTRQTSLFFQDTWQLRPSLKAVGGLRYAYNRSTRSHHWEPRLSADYRVTGNFFLKAAWGRYHQFVLQLDEGYPQSYGPISWILADSRYVRPAFAEHRILGARFSNNSILFDVEFYDKYLKGTFSFVTTDPDFGNDTTAMLLNRNYGYSRGMDILLQKKGGPFSGWIGYGYNTTRIHYQLPGTDLSYPMDQDTPHNLKLVLFYQFKKWLVSLTWLYSSGKPYSTPVVKNVADPGDPPMYVLVTQNGRNTRRLPSTHRLDFSLTRKFSRKHFHGSIGLSVFNLYNRRNIWYRYFTLRENAAIPVDMKSFGIKPTITFEITF